MYDDCIPVDGSILISIWAAEIGVSWLLEKKDMKMGIGVNLERFRREMGFEYDQNALIKFSKN